MVEQKAKIYKYFLINGLFGDSKNIQELIQYMKSKR